MSQTKLNLRHPVKLGDETITSLELRRPTAGDLRVMDERKGDISKQIALTARLTALPEKTIEQLDAADFVELGEVLAGLLGKSPATGGTS